MKLQSRKDQPKVDYPAFESHHLNRRATLAAATALLLTASCEKKATPPPAAAVQIGEKAPFTPKQRKLLMEPRIRPHMRIRGGHSSDSLRFLRVPNISYPDIPVIPPDSICFSNEPNERQMLLGIITQPEPPKPKT